MTEKPTAVDLARDIQTNVGLALQDNGSENALRALQQDSRYLYGHPTFQSGTGFTVDNQPYEDAVVAELKRLEGNGSLPKVSLTSEAMIMSTVDLPGRHLKNALLAKPNNSLGSNEGTPTVVNNSRTLMVDWTGPAQILDFTKNEM